VQITDLRQDYHRNGIGGEGYVLSFFRATEIDDDASSAVPMMAVSWGENDERECAVFRLSEIAKAAMAYLDGWTPDVIDDFPPREDEPIRHVYIGAWRSTDQFLPALIRAADERPCVSCGQPSGQQYGEDALGRYHIHGNISRPQCHGCSERCPAA